jgi:uncharacterized protein YbjT (DUF2867 family)
MRTLGLPLTVLRPAAFMEIMTDKEFYPAVAVWKVMPKLTGSDTPLPWLAVDDLGAIAAKAFGDRSRFVGADIPLAADMRTIDECRTSWRQVHGSPPRTFPMPVWLFRRIAGYTGKDLPTMWRWLRSGTVRGGTGPAREIHPDALTVREWLDRRASPPRR